MRILLASLVLLAGCASQSAMTTAPGSPALTENYARLSRTYPAFTNKLREFMLTAMDKHHLGGGEPLIKCSLTSFLTGIPDGDLALMEAGVETRELTPERKAAFIKWMDPSFTHGDENGTTYEDGTPRNYAAEDAMSSRIGGNARDLCPDLLAQYPAAFHF